MFINISIENLFERSLSSGMQIYNNEIYIKYTHTAISFYKIEQT